MSDAQRREPESRCRNASGGARIAAVDQRAIFHLTGLRRRFSPEEIENCALHLIEHLIRIHCGWRSRGFALASRKSRQSRCKRKSTAAAQQLSSGQATIEAHESPSFECIRLTVGLLITK